MLGCALRVASHAKAALPTAVRRAARGAQYRGGPRIQRLRTSSLAGRAFQQARPLASARAGTPEHGVPIADLAAYAAQWSAGLHVPADKAQLEAKLVGLARDVFELPDAGPHTCMPLDEAELMLTDIGVSPDGLPAFLAGETGAAAEEEEGGEPDASDLETPEFREFLGWCQANLQGSQDVLDFAAKRGQRVQVFNSAAKITAANGECIPRIQCFHKKAWSPGGGDWQRVMAQLWRMGLRPDAADSEPRRWCDWCGQKRGFQSPDAIAACTSTHFSCRNQMDSK